MERLTIIVDARDRFSTTLQCLDTLLVNTPDPFDLIVVMGGAPDHLKKAWLERFGDRARFIFRPTFLNQAQARNLAMREAGTRLAVLMDNDNYVRPGWLEALVQCQQETGAVMVVPIVLEPPNRIHTAGNDLYITYKNGKGIGYKHLRYHNMVHVEGCNLGRQPTDYAELHCQLVEVEPTLRLNAYDENILEVGEVDQGLTYQKAGLSMYVEPAATVLYQLGRPLEEDDIKLFAWRWDINSVHRGYQYFEQKWGFDISEDGTFRDWLVRYNSQLGLLPRMWPSAAALKLDSAIGQSCRRVVELCRIPAYRLREYKKRKLGYYNWTIGVTNGEER